MTSASLLLEGVLDLEGSTGRSTLHHAAAAGRLDVIELLLDAGADIGARDPEYNAVPIQWAKFFDQPEAAALLAERYKSRF